MSTTVSYKGSTIATVDNNTKTLNTAGKYLEANVVLTDSGGGGGVIQDENGGLHFLEDGVNAFSDAVTTLPNGGLHHVITGVMASDGLEYEEGTYIPSSDVTRPEILFTNNHNTAPIFIQIVDVDSTFVNTTYSNTAWFYMDWYTLWGNGQKTNGSADNYVFVYYRSIGSSISGSSGSVRYLNILPTNSGDSSEQYPRYFAKEDRFYPFCSNNFYWRASQTYKWIAVWR